jgi:transposase-like protein
MLRAGRTPRELAQSLGVSEQTLRHWRRQDQVDRDERDDGVTSDERGEPQRGIGLRVPSGRGVAGVPGPTRPTEAMVEAELIEAICFCGGSAVPRAVAKHLAAGMSLGSCGWRSARLLVRDVTAHRRRLRHTAWRADVRG